MSSKKRIARELLDTRRLALGHATTPQLSAASLDGGRLEFKDGSGKPIGGLGPSDNGFGIDYYDGPTPPRTTAPKVTTDAGLMRIVWDGNFADTQDDEGVLPTSDADRVEIHASMDENFIPNPVESYAGAFTTLDGGSFTLGPLETAGTWYVCLVTRSKAGKYSNPSDRVAQELAITSIDLAVTDAWLTGDAAQVTADGKNGIWRGPEAPTEDPDVPFKDGDIWFEMTEDGKSIPNIWDDTLGEWVGNDDFRQSEIERVQTELREDLDSIVVDGSGTKNFYRDTMPTDEESSEGDLWFNSSDENKPYIYQDGEWVTVASSFATPGAGEALSTIADGISLSKAVTSDAEFAEDTSKDGRWTYDGTVTTGDLTFAIPAVGGVDSTTFDMTFDGTEATKVGLGLVADTALYINSPGGTPVVESIFFVAGGSVPEPTVTADAAPVEVGDGGLSGATHHMEDLGELAKSLLASYLAGGLVDQIAFGLRVTLPYAPGAWVDVSTLSVTQAVTGNGITDNAITTDKIAVGAITAESGIIGSINAGTITVGEMNGARIKAQTIDADTVLIGSSIGSTLIKDGAILTEHIEAGSITAESGIIGSIDANVITSGKIMGNQIDADAINGKTITGATIRTASSGGRVELTQNGLKQYNSLGAVITDMSLGSFTLNGGTITGSTIKTATSGNRVEITSTGLKQYGNGNEVLVAMTGGQLNLKGNLEQVNSIADMKVGPAFTTGVSPGLAWSDIGGTSQWAGVAAMNPAEGPTLVTQGPGTGTWLKQRNGYSQLRNTRGSGGSWLTLSGEANWLDWSHPTNSGYSSLKQQDRYLQLGSWDSRGDAVGFLKVDPDSTVLSAYKRELELWGGNGGHIKIDGASGGRVYSTSIYNYTSGGSANLAINSNGTIYRATSSLRYKADVEPSRELASVLDIEPKTWRSKADVERAAEVAELRAKTGEGPVPQELADGLNGDARYYGAIAEEVHDLGLTELVEYDNFGRPDALNYDKFGVALIPIVRELRDRIEQLETQLASA